MRVILTRSAKAELAEAVSWYDARLSEAADRFVDEFEALKNRLRQNPRQFPAFMPAVILGTGGVE